MATQCPKCNTENPSDSKYCKECATPLPSAEDVQPSFTKTLLTPVKDLAQGTLFAGRYEIIEELGKGGMGKVYKALDNEIHVEVAIKLLKPEIAADEKIIERFRNELKIAREIAHKNVCKVFHFGKEDQSPYITMEYVYGEDLKNLIKKKGKLPKEEALSIAKQVCLGLVEAHELGVVHRDLKPQNIMIDASGNAKIMDFGIARSVEAEGVTEVGMIIGTPDYISPEQAEGEEADQRSDIYSFGVILYEMLTGTVPFKGDTAFSVALKHKSQLPYDPRKINPDVSDDLSRLILICMEKERERRYQTTEELLVDLQNIEEGLPLGTKIKPRRATFTQTLLRKKLFIPALVVVFTIIAIIIWQWILKSTKPSLPTSDRPSVAIMYFKNNTGDQNLDFLSKTLPALMTIDLIQSKHLYVLPNDRLIQIMNRLELKEIGDYSRDVLEKVADWGVVEHIIQGGYFKAGDDFRISLQIQKTGSWEIIGGETLSGQLDLHTRMVDELTPKIKSYFNLTAQEISGDIDFDIGKITTELPEAFAYFNEGIKHFGKSDWTATIESFRKALEIDPQFAMAHSFLGWTYSFRGRYTEAREHIEKALGATERLTDKERFFVEAIYYGLLEQKYGKAEESLKKILELYPEDWLANYMLGYLYLGLEEWEKARDLFLENKRNRLDFTMNYQKLAIAYKYGGLYDEAIEVCEYALENFSDTSYIRYELAHAYLCKGRLETALEVVNEAQSLHPRDSAFYGALIWLKGNILMCMEDWPKAEQEFQRLISESLRGGLNSFFGFDRLGHMFKTQGKLKECIEMFKKGIEGTKIKKYFTWEMSFNKNLAYTYLESGNLAEALKASEKRMRLAMKFQNQPDFRTQFLKGYVWVRMGAIKEAQNAADELKVMVDNGLDKKIIRYYYLLMGMIEFKKNNYKDAESYQTLALSLLPFQVPYSTGFVDHAIFHNAIAMTYHKSGELDKAQIQYEKIISLTEGRLNFGIIYAKSYYMLGKIFEQKGWKGKASENYEKFLDLWKDADPGIAEVKDVRRRLAGLKNQ
jgi:serine/threonine protein kinase/tetratricopeptide (TPR) repeat protein